MAFGQEEILGMRRGFRGWTAFLPEDNRQHFSLRTTPTRAKRMARTGHPQIRQSFFFACLATANPRFTERVPFGMPAPSKRPLLILDFDETLIHGVEAVLHRPADFRVGPFHIYRRPYLGTFLESASAIYDLAIWSSASAGYVEAIARQIAVAGSDWHFVWSRSRCIQRMNPENFEIQFIKDLKKVKRTGYELERVLIVDDSYHKVARNYGNAIYVRPFEGAEDDAELLLLGDYLSSLRNANDFRRIEKRGWRSRVLGT